MSRSNLIQRAIVGISLVLFVGGGFATATSYWVQQSDYAVIVDGERISQVEFQRRLVETRQMFRSSQLPEPMVQKAALNHLTERVLLLQEARRRDLQVSEGEIDGEWQQLLNETYGGRADRMSQDLHRSFYTEFSFRQELRQRLLMRKLQEAFSAGVKLPEAKAREYYLQHQNQYRQPERIEARHILFKADEAKPDQVQKARVKAEALLAKLKAGGDFEKLARQYSEDEGSKTSGGQLGAFAKGEMVPAFEAAAWTLVPGTIAPQPVKTSYGWHLIQRGKTLPARLKPFAEARAEFEPQLLDQRRQEALQQWLKSRRQAARIEVNPALVQEPASPKAAGTGAADKPALPRPASS